MSHRAAPASRGRCSGGRCEHLVLEQGDQARRDVWVSDRPQSVEGGEAEKELTRLGDRCKRVRRLGRAEPSERFHGVVPHVLVLVTERVEKRLDGAVTALIAEGKR